MDKENKQAPNGSQQDDQHEDPEPDPEENMDEEAAAKEKLTSSDPNKVKFTSVNLDGFDGKNGEAKVDIHVAQTSVGMGKDELMKYANEPFWVRLRMFLFVLFWVAWVAMLVGAVVIILLAPRCPPAPQLEWYQKTVMYQVDVGAFKDSDGNGVGDLKGLTSKLSYFKDQNVGTLMMSAIFKSSPNSDGWIDHNEIDTKYGTITDFENLVKEMSEKDIKLVLDFNPNHSSDEHPWFKASIEEQEPFKDFYVWVDPADDGGPPTNWLSVNGDSAWKYNDKRNQFYLHTFDDNKPDLNLRNELVRKELKDILQFWLEKGVDGFKVVAASHLIESKDLKDEALNIEKTVEAPQYKDYNHLYTVDQEENFDLFAEWRDILNNFTESTGIPKILLAQVSGTVSRSMDYYGNETSKLADFPINSILTELHHDVNAKKLKDHLDAWIRGSPSYAWPNWLLGSKDVKRLASRVGSSLLDGIHMVTMLAKGTPITYFGDELGLTDHADHDHDHDHSSHMTNLKESSTQTVMLWTNDSYGGFTNGSSMYLVDPSYETINVEMQEKNKQSHLKIYSRLLGLRNQPALNFGLQEYPLVRDDVFSMIRVRKGSPGYLVVFNMSPNATTIDFSETSSYLPEAARVEIRSGNLDEGILADGDHPKVFLNNIPLESKQAVVFSFVPQFEG